MKREELKKLARRRIFDIEIWPAGKPIDELKEELGLPDLARMDTNENPLGPSPGAVKAMEQAIRHVNFYPDGPCLRLKRKLAGRLGISEDMVAFGNGADSCIRMVASAFINDGEEVVMADPSFPVYSIFTRVMGGEEVLVPLKDYTHDLQAMKKKIGPRTKLVCICNPNNPTGSIVRKAELDDFFRDLPSDVIVVLDEAYFEFVSDPQFPNGLDYLREGRNIIVMRTFSKLYGLAGLRIGYMMAAPEMISVLERVREPYTVAGVAEEAALAALDDREFIDRVIRNNEKSRNLICRELDRLGLDYVPSHTNFLFVDLKTDARKVREALMRRGFLIRAGTAWKLPTCVRITFGTEAQNAAFIRALEEVLGGGR
ncbi:MAG: histidinol-phosphate transaminase [Spirochaetales bacterium]|nr:histidinol-phosphate transaminase [Spirochaetales bacterium]